MAIGTRRSQVGVSTGNATYDRHRNLLQTCFKMTFTIPSVIRFHNTIPNDYPYVGTVGCPVGYHNTILNMALNITPYIYYVCL